MSEFINFIESKVQNYMKIHNINNKELCRPKLFHWSHAEKSIFDIINRRHNDKWIEWKKFLKIIEKKPKNYSPWCIEQTELLDSKKLFFSNI